MSASSDNAADQFLAIADQFKLGALVTESSHPVTAHLSETAAASIADGLAQLFEVDRDVLEAYRRWVVSGAPKRVSGEVTGALGRGGKVFFTGCGSTGRLSIQLSSIWRGYFQGAAHACPVREAEARALEDRAISVMAGGDFALIKSVEGFEDHADFGRRQIAERGVAAGDVVFAITEGGETSFVIGTAWMGIEQGAKVYFVYCNPDDVLCSHVERSREIISDPRIETINLTTGPMAITGSTRMQATSIQLCVMLTVLEMTVRELTGQLAPDTVPEEFLAALERAMGTLSSGGFRAQLAALVAAEEEVYRNDRRNNYFAEALAMDVLTDTTERSPTFCTPPFRKRGDEEAAESWAFLFTPHLDTEDAWRSLLKREPDCIEWPEEEVRAHGIGRDELMRFRIGADGIALRPPRRGDGAVVIARACELDDEIFRARLLDARGAGATTAVVAVGTGDREAPPDWPVDVFVHLTVPETRLLLDGVTRVAVKMTLNALSTCTMVRLGRVMGNTMIYVVPSNLKLIDRAIRYISSLAGIGYEEACRLAFEVIEYVRPRMVKGQAYPPVVGMGVLRAREGLSNEDAEARNPLTPRAPAAPRRMPDSV